jgi:hypothetical protein
MQPPTPEWGVMISEGSAFIVSVSGGCRSSRHGAYSHDRRFIPGRGRSECPYRTVVRRDGSRALASNLGVKRPCKVPVQCLSSAGGALVGGQREPGKSVPMSSLMSARSLAHLHAAVVVEELYRCGVEVFFYPRARTIPARSGPGSASGMLTRLFNDELARLLGPGCGERWRVALSDLYLGDGRGQLSAKPW